MINSKEKKFALHYMNTLIEIVREAIVILDSDLRVVLANPIFYQNFMVTPARTENILLYDLGNGQWNIPELRSLMEKILPNKKIVKDYAVKHVFETIGQKTILLNARQLDSMQLIILAMEDITDKENLVKKLDEYTKGLEVKIVERTAELAQRVNELEVANKNMVGRELKMVELKKEINDLKKRIKNGNGKNENNS